MCDLADVVRHRLRHTCVAHASRRKMAIGAARPPGSILEYASRRRTCREWVGDHLQAPMTRTLEGDTDQAQ